MARFKFSFWLDCDKDDELLLAEEIDTLKRGRAFAGAIRDGLRLVVDLRKGNLDALLALFPWVEEKIKARGGGELDELKQELSMLQQLIMQQGRNDGAIMQPLGGPKPLAVPAITAPDFDDDEDVTITVRKDKSSGASAVQNFLNATNALQSIVAD